MQLYEVGGAVRDGLLGLKAVDRDWVAVGATPEEMVALGYRPVGRDFPVFLHPQTHEEVALARTERKSGRGYHGFAFHAAPTVSLEEDLQRRDLTINAMARDASGQLIDPYGGQQDLRDGVLRHVSPAFVEDPVRLLRVARLAARYASFTLAPETLQLLQRMVQDGEVDALVAERVWQELSRGLMEQRPSRMQDVLVDSGAWTRLLPELPLTPEQRRRRAAAMDLCATQQQPLPVRFAVLCAGAAPAAAQQVALRWRVPRDCCDMALMLARENDQVRGACVLSASEVVALFDRNDAWRRPQRWEQLLRAVQVLAASQAGGPAAGAGDAAIDHLRHLLEAGTAVDAGAVAQHAAAAGARGQAVSDAVHRARVQAVAAAAEAAEARSAPANNKPL